MGLEVLQAVAGVPTTPQKPVADTVHGVVITDPYRWLEDKKAPEVVEWTRRQHDHTLGYIATLPALDDVRAEVVAFIDRDITGPPSLRANRQFFSRKKRGEDQYKLYTRLDDGKEVLLFDPLKLDPSGKSSITGAAYTKDAGRVAIGLQNKGAEISDYYIIDTRTGKQIGEPVRGLRSFAWARDEKSAYIVPATMEMLSSQTPLATYRHVLGTDRSKDVFMISPGDAKNIAGVWDATDAEVTFYSFGDFYSNTLQVVRPGKDKEPLTIYSSTTSKATPYAEGDALYVLTNDGAPMFTLKKGSLASPDSKNWKTLIPERPDVVIENFDITADGTLVLQVKRDVLSSLELYTPAGELQGTLELPEPGDVARISYHKESNSLFVSLTSFTQPPSVWRYTMANKKWTLHYRNDSTYDTDSLTWKQVFVTSKDGTRVPVFLVHRKDVVLDGNNPTLLYGYGGFNVSMSPSYVGNLASFLNRGGVYALACLRGGAEYGEEWHRNGMLDKKQNVYDDAAAIAEYLIRERWTNPSKLAIKGGSNGGLLVGAMITQRPDLFKAAVCAVPLLDMVRYHKFLIARYWIPEYGDPDKKEDFSVLLRYSPQHNVRSGLNLPATLVTAGEYDTRVDPLHAKKFVAAVQNNPGQVSPFLLYMDYDSGHGSGKPISKVVDDIVNEYRFLFYHLGITQ